MAYVTKVEGEGLFPFWVPGVEEEGLRRGACPAAGGGVLWRRRDTAPTLLHGTVGGYVTVGGHVKVCVAGV
jgi:hypothetical protein